MSCVPFRPVKRALGFNFQTVGVKNSNEEWVKRGVIGIVCRKSKRIYLEGTNNVEHSYRNHTRSLASGSHRNPYLQADYVLYGPNSFTFELLEFVLSTDPLREATMRQQAKYSNRLYNPDHRPRNR